ncbi:MAG TPA: sigma 54-interacting transcriptional regulator [Polyangiaceae bacterium]
MLVFWQGGFASLALPRAGTVTIGRGDGCDVRVDHPSVSRRHAALHVTTREDEVDVQVEDLGSSNGTRKNGERLGPKTITSVFAGDSLEIGSTTAVLAGIRAAGSGEGPRPSVRRRVERVVRDPRMLSLYELLRDVAQSKLSVLLLGETGVGKEIFAEALWEASPRAGAPFVRLNTAAIPETLFESTLFGQERGAFTGATQSRPGLLEMADGGTLFLDEIGDLPLLVQAKLLRVLESGEVARVGASKAKTVDVRFVSATNRDLERAMEEGTFRRDLYYRLNGATLRILPLRERSSEIVPLAHAFAQEICASLDRPEASFTAETEATLAAYAWPGNVRELRQVVERSILVSRGQPVTPAHLPDEVRGSALAPLSVPPASATVHAPTLPPAPPTTTSLDPAPPVQLRSSVEQFERARIQEALNACGGNQTEAARMLGIARRTLVSRIEAYGLPRPRKGAPKS